MWEKPETKCRQSIVRLYVKAKSSNVFGENFTLPHEGLGKNFNAVF